jgi:hypothetical protein
MVFSLAEKAELRAILFQTLILVERINIMVLIPLQMEKLIALPRL